VVTITILALATILGFVLTLWGIVGAYTGAKRDVIESQERAATIKRLENEERAEGIADRAAEPQGDSRARIAKYEAIYADLGIVRTTNDNLPGVGARETARLLEMVVKSTRSNLIIAGFGLGASTLASLGSLFV
jgi:hypothetical protein